MASLAAGAGARAAEATVLARVEAARVAAAREP